MRKPDAALAAKSTDTLSSTGTGPVVSTEDLIARLPDVARLRSAAAKIDRAELARLLDDPVVQADVKLTGEVKWSHARTEAWARLESRGLWEPVVPEPSKPVVPEAVARGYVTPRRAAASSAARAKMLGADGKPIAPALPTALWDRVSEIQTEEVRYLWPGRLPLRRVVGIIGRQGQGKSTLVGWLAAQVSRGLPWPDCPSVPNEPGSVVILQAEEIASEDLRPRLESMNADLARVAVVKAVKRGDSESSLNLCHDVEVLSRMLDDFRDVKLIIVDPISSYVRGISGYNDTEVRAFMEPLFALAKDRGICVVLVMHPSKNTEADILDRAGNSAAFTQMARVVWYYSTDPRNRTRRVLSLVKGNPPGITKTALSAGYRAGRLSWSSKVIRMSAFDVDNALSRISRDERLTGRPGRDPATRRITEDFILSTIPNWPMLRSAVLDLAVASGLAIKEGTFRLAISRLEDARKLDSIVHPEDGRLWLHPPAVVPPLDSEPPAEPAALEPPAGLAPEAPSGSPGKAPRIAQEASGGVSTGDSTPESLLEPPRGGFPLARLACEAFVMGWETWPVARIELLDAAKGVGIPEGTFIRAMEHLLRTGQIRRKKDRSRVLFERVLLTS